MSRTKVLISADAVAARLISAQVMTGNVQLLSDLHKRALSGLPRQAGPVATASQDSSSRALGGWRAPHCRHERCAFGHAEVPDAPEAEVLVPGDAVRLARLQIGRLPVLVAAVQPRSQQQAGESEALPGGIDADRLQVPVRFLRVGALQSTPIPCCPAQRSGQGP